jgi:hypothetical protein
LVFCCFAVGTLTHADSLQYNSDLDTPRELAGLHSSSPPHYRKAKPSVCAGRHEKVQASANQ